MLRQIIFSLILLITLSVFAYTLNRLIKFFSFTRPAFPVKDFGKRFRLMLRVAFGQTKIFRRPVIGFFHALVFWGFCIILLGSIEMVIDGLAATERILHVLGPVYNFIVASGDIFAILVTISVIIFCQAPFHIKRFEGIEMKRVSHIDANAALSLILLLMISLLAMNTGYVGYTTLSGSESYGVYPVSSLLAGFCTTMLPEDFRLMYNISWWTHILLIFVFANYLPYSKHFHVFMSVPNVFLSRLDPLGKLTNMDNITKEVRLMLDPNTAFTASSADTPLERFGVKDAEDATWKNYFDSLSCTECGRCTSVCPANITGKEIVTAEVMMDLRAMKKRALMIRNGRISVIALPLQDFISEEELGMYNM
jgi:ferredoxin